MDFSVFIGSSWQPMSRSNVDWSPTEGKQETTHDFFLAGRQIPWYAVSASIIATTISAVTFIGVPAIAFASDGNFARLQLAIGGVIARLLIARYLIPRYYQADYYSPYDYMSDRLGVGIGRLTTGLFIVGGILGQSVRVYATALVFELLTGWSMAESITVIALFAILWTMGVSPLSSGPTWCNSSF